jgi:hypothetical protein
MLGARLQLVGCQHSVHSAINSSDVFHGGHGKRGCPRVQLAMPPYGVLASSTCATSAVSSLQQLYGIALPGSSGSITLVPIHI